MPEFQYIEFFLLLLVIPVLIAVFYLSVKRKKSIALKIGDPELVKQMTSDYNGSAYLKKFILVLVAVILLVFCLANLRTRAGEQKVSRNGIDLMIAIDVSKSMLAQDIKPSRLERARQFLSRLIDKLGNNRVGIVIFAGKAYLQMPLTADHAAAKMYISSASTESVPTQGTVIGDALKMCFASFNGEEKKYKAVVLITDGEDHDESAIKVAEQMARSGVIIHTVGMGSLQGVPLPDETTNDYKKDNEGNTVITKLNQELLQTIAQKGNGIYQLFQNTEATTAGILTQLDNMEQRAITDDSLVNFKSFFQWFLLAVLLALLIEFFMSERKRNGIKIPFMKKAAFIITGLLLSQISYAQEDNELVKTGNKAYTAKEYDKAVEQYNAALKKNAGNAAASYNLGNASYKAGKKEEAIAAYDDAMANLKTPVEKSNALFNKGVVLQNDKKLPECIDAYKQALRLDPSNEDARQNLQKALIQQKEEQKKKEQEKEKKEPKKDKQDKEKQDPKPQPSKLSKQDAENKLKALQQKEKELQDKLHKVNSATVTRPEKDW